MSEKDAEAIDNIQKEKKKEPTTSKAGACIFALLFFSFLGWVIPDALKQTDGDLVREACVYFLDNSDQNPEISEKLIEIINVNDGVFFLATRGEILAVEINVKSKMEYEKIAYDTILNINDVDIKRIIDTFKDRIDKSSIRIEELADGTVKIRFKHNQDGMIIDDVFFVEKTEKLENAIIAMNRLKILSESSRYELRSETEQLYCESTLIVKLKNGEFENGIDENEKSKLKSTIENKKRYLLREIIQNAKEIKDETYFPMTIDDANEIIKDNNYNCEIIIEKKKKKKNVYTYNLVCKLDGNILFLIENVDKELGKEFEEILELSDQCEKLETYEEKVQKAKEERKKGIKEERDK